MSKPLFVFDYDGVILNSLYEKLVVGFNAHLRLNGGSNLLGGVPLSFHDYRDRLRLEPDIYNAFCACVPMIGDLGENCAAFRLIEAGERFPDRESFNKRISCFGDDYLRNCSKEVLHLRRAYAQQDGYAELCPPFHTVLRDISGLVKQTDFAICTTKPLENVQHFNRTLGIEDLFVDIHVCDDRTSKVDVLEMIAQDHTMNHDQIGFIDDFARHLIPANAAGFCCLYADWGFGEEGDKIAIAQAGIPSVSLDEFAGALAQFIAGHDHGH